LKNYDLLRAHAVCKDFASIKTLEAAGVDLRSWVKMTITFRVLNQMDSAAYRSLRLEALQRNPEAYGSSYAEATKQPKMFFEAAIDCESKSQWVLGAFDEDELIGIFAYSDENGFGIANTGTLIQMYVINSYRGRGIGLQLTRTILKQIFALHSVEQVVLEVKKGNEAARSVYLEAGFKHLEMPVSKEGIECLSYLRTDC
jgi:RimJ/RimL family protein N-acetyltransferase